MNIHLDLLHSMMRIRKIEEGIADYYPKQNMRCPVHLSIGQEVVAAAAGLALDKVDYAVSTHRGHAHYLGKGGDPKAMLAEIHGKAAGCSRGRGGSMHLIDQSVNFMGTTAIVGNSIPIGVGLGLASKLENEQRISCVFIGDGAIEEGVFYEAANFAAVKKLPVLFICENNLYSVYSPLLVRQPLGRKIHKMVAAMGLSTSASDSSSAKVTLEIIQSAVEYVRNGNGPHFVELATYRWREHCGPNFDNDLSYRSEDEFLAWKERDPLEHLKNELLLENILSRDELDKLIINLEQEVESAFLFAESAPFPQLKEAYLDEYYISGNNKFEPNSVI